MSTDTTDPLAQFGTPRKGYARSWLQCKECSAVFYHDYVPYSLSNPIMSLPCGHGVGRRFSEVAPQITEAAARAHFQADADKEQPTDADRLAALEAENRGLREALTVRLWTTEMHAAWHQNLPDVSCAFEALREIALAGGAK